MLLAEHPAAGAPRVVYLRRAEGGVQVCSADVAALPGPDVDALRAARPAAHAALVDDVADLRCGHAAIARFPRPHCARDPPFPR